MTIRNKIGLKGKVTLEVFGPDGELKHFEPNFWQKLLGLQGSPMRVENHNIVTSEGDALVADILADSSTRQKFDNTHAYIEVGTGYTGSDNKNQASCNTPTGSPEVMDSSYPQTKGSFGAANDSVIQYKATFEAGDLKCFWN